MLKLRQTAPHRAPTQGPFMDGLTLATTLAQIAWEKKGDDVVILDLRERHTEGQGRPLTGRRPPQAPTMRGAEPSTVPSLLLIEPDSTSRS